MRCRSFLVAIVFTSTFATSDLFAQVGPYSYHTLEERILNSETVLLAKIVKITGERRQLGQDTYKIAFEMERVFKRPADRIHGGQTDESNGYFYLFAKREEIEAWIKLKTRLVISSPVHTFANSESARVLVDLTQKNLQCLSLRDDGVLRALTSEKDILAAIKHTSQKLPGVTRIHTHQMKTEKKLVIEANLVVQDGFPIAFVPVDKPLETWAKRKISSGKGVPIGPAIRALAHFPSDTNADWVRNEIANRKSSSEQAALKGLLNDWDLSDK